MSLTKKIDDLGKRVGALESSGLDEDVGFAKITKVYGKFKITAKIRTSVHTYKTCDATLVCDQTMLI